MPSDSTIPGAALRCVGWRLRWPCAAGFDPVTVAQSVDGPLITFDEGQHSFTPPFTGGTVLLLLPP